MFSFIVLQILFVSKRWALEYKRFLQTFLLWFWCYRNISEGAVRCQVLHTDSLGAIAKGNKPETFISIGNKTSTVCKALAVKPDNQKTIRYRERDSA